MQINPYWEDEWLYANYWAFADATGERQPLSHARFSGLLEDLCQQQLGPSEVRRGRGKGGAYLIGLRLRTEPDPDGRGLIAQALTLTIAVASAGDEGDGRVMAQTLGSNELKPLVVTKMMGMMGC